MKKDDIKAEITINKIYCPVCKTQNIKHQITDKTPFVQLEQGKMNIPLKLFKCNVCTTLFLIDYTKC